MKHAVDPARDYLLLELEPRSVNVGDGSRIKRAELPHVRCILSSRRRVNNSRPRLVAGFPRRAAVEESPCFGKSIHVDVPTTQNMARRGELQLQRVHESELAISNKGAWRIDIVLNKQSLHLPHRPSVILLFLSAEKSRAKMWSDVVSGASANVEERHSVTIRLIRAVE